MIGRSLGHYEIVAALGAGGMGEVWRARDPRLDRDVALKVLPAEVAEDPERLARFEREARALAALSHPNIVTIYSVEQADGVPFLTMELVEGETLERSIPPGGMAVERFLEVAVALAEALATAHGQGVLHRDLKPGNVMVTPAGRVKVLDFGLAKLAGEPTGDPLDGPTATLEELTREGRIVGTVPYMAPEQLQGQRVDARSDIFSLGVVLYQMATGRRPFTGESSVALFSSILRDEPESVTELRPELPRQLGHILRRGLAKNPERRFQSAKDLRNELEELREELSEARVVEKLEGQRRSRSASVEPAVAPQTAVSTRYRRLALGALVAIPVMIAALVLVRSGDERARPAEPSAPAVAEPAFPRTAIAVLPFANLSADQADAFFAGGLHDEVLTQLSRVTALSPRGRTSVMGYAGTTKPLREIAEELEVGALLEGSVQVVAGRLRVGVRLLDTSTAEPLWAETYDRTLDDAFAIQSDVAQRVVAAVGAALGGAERETLTQAPTADAEAYRLYLQGREYFRRPATVRQNWEIAQQLYERAVELAPEFALAWAALSEVHGSMHWIRYDTSPVRVASQREAAERALRLAPEAPEAHLAMGLWHYWGRRDYAAALGELDVALQGMPNDARLVALTGAVHRRLGNWEQVIAAFERAIELDPRDATLFFDLGGNSLMAMRRYAEAVEAFDRASSLAPDLHFAAAWKGRAHLLWHGRLDTMRSELARAPSDQLLHERARLFLRERDAEGLLDLLAAVPDAAIEEFYAFIPKALYAAWAHQLEGDRDAARAEYAAALEVIDSAMLEIADDWRLHAARGLALAGLERRDAALREAAWLQRSVVYREDALLGPSSVAPFRAQILAQAGEAEGALDEVEWILSRPAWFSIHELRLDPLFDPLRDHPRYHRLLAEYSSSAT
jgi:TolB-like protein/Flp pilus assembly protein TadD